MKKCLIDRGYNEIIDEGDIVGKYPEQPLLISSYKLTNQLARATI